MMRLRLCFLGPMQVFLDGKAVTFESNKVRALLAYLAAEAPRLQFRESLAEMLWPDWPQQSAMNNLRYALADLRKNLADREAQPPFLVISRESLQLNLASDVWVDTAAFLKDEDVDLYRGPFLEGFSVSDSPGFTEWLLSKRSYYQQQIMKTLRKEADHCEQTQQYERGLAYARQQLAIEPWLEEAHGQAMRLLALSGQRSAALVQYEECRRLLEKELGAAPSGETWQLFESIRLGQWPPAAAPVPAPPPISVVENPPRHNLPVQLTRLIGREQAVAEIKSLLEQSALVTLTGSGGIGKTRLSIAVADEVHQDFPDGVWFIELAPVFDPGEIAPAIVRTLGVVLSTSRTAEETLLTFLGTRQVLLVLDTCEHLIDACAQLAERLLQRCPHLKLLASSREALGIPGEIAYRVPSLAVPDAGRLPDLEECRQSAAVQLFTVRARAVQPEFEVTESNAGAVAQICQRLDGIPLAIELAAARVTLLSPTQLAARLGDAFRLLTGGMRTALPRQQTLRATIDWSYNLLTGQEQALFRRLAIFAGSFILEAAEEVCSGEGLADDQIMDLLGSLVNKSIVHVLQGKSETPRYRLLETIRQYAREKLIESDEMQALRNRHLDYYAHFAEMAEEHYQQQDRLPWIHRFAAEMDNLRAAVEWSYQGLKQPVPGLRIAAALYKLMQIAGMVTEEMTWLKTGLEGFGEAPIPNLLRARALFALAHQISHLMDGYLIIPELCERAVQICQEIGPEGFQIHSSILGIWSYALTNYGRRDGEYDTSFRLAEKRIEVARQAKSPLELSHAIGGKAWLLLWSKQYEKAQVCMEESLQMRRQNQIPVDGADFWFFAEIALSKGNLDQAIAYNLEALAAFRSYEDLFGCGFTFLDLGPIYRSKQDWVQTAFCAKQSLKIAESINVAWMIRSSLVFLMQVEIYWISQTAGADQRKYMQNLAVLLGAITSHFEDKQSDCDQAREVLNGWPDAGVYDQSLMQATAMSLNEAVKFALNL